MEERGISALLNRYNVSLELRDGGRELGNRGGWLRKPKRLVLRSEVRR